MRAIAFTAAIVTAFFAADAAAADAASTMPGTVLWTRAGVAEMFVAPTTSSHNTNINNNQNRDMKNANAAEMTSVLVLPGMDSDSVSSVHRSTQVISPTTGQTLWSAPGQTYKSGICGAAIATYSNTSAAAVVVYRDTKTGAIVARAPQDPTSGGMGMFPRTCADDGTAVYAVGTPTRELFLGTLTTAVSVKKVLPTLPQYSMLTPFVGGSGLLIGKKFPTKEYEDVAAVSLNGQGPLSVHVRGVFPVSSSVEIFTYASCFGAPGRKFCPFANANATRLLGVYGIVTAIPQPTPYATSWSIATGNATVALFVAPSAFGGGSYIAGFDPVLGGKFFSFVSMNVKCKYSSAPTNVLFAAGGVIVFSYNNGFVTAIRTTASEGADIWSKTVGSTVALNAAKTTMYAIDQNSNCAAILAVDVELGTSKSIPFSSPGCAVDKTPVVVVVDGVVIVTKLGQVNTTVAVAV